MIFLVLVIPAHAQISAEEAFKKVFDVLTEKEIKLEGDLLPKLTSRAWESLSYINEAESYQPEDLQEAVPDYYHFTKDKVIIRLINQGNYNEYGVELELAYRLKEGYIEILDMKTGEMKDKWRLMYLDDNYMALDMGDLRVFFTHTANQE